MASAEKIERLVNLIALLLNARRALSAEDIRSKIPGYAGQGDQAFHRMFERDKEELKELGYVLEIEEPDLVRPIPAYRISRRDALLEDPELTPEETAALSLAVQAWGDRGSDGVLGLLKLSVGSGDAEPGPTGFVLPRVPVDQNLATVLDAIAARKTVRFLYRTGGGGEPQERVVDPYAVHHRGVWYLAGHDHARGEVRRFRLTRVQGSVHMSKGAAPDFDAPDAPAATVPHGPWEGEEIARATIEFAPEAAWWVQRRTPATVRAERAGGWVEVEMPVADVDSFAGWIAGFADTAVVREPPELRRAVVELLREAAR
ncbi:MAG TPA: WYL domain-containing protein [Actinomycetota bacterium]|nr:WYL domain-containing protein [Actinomycetota bacterium]